MTSLTKTKSRVTQCPKEGHVMKVRKVTRYWQRLDGTDTMKVYTQEFCGTCHAERVREAEQRKRKRSAILK